MWCRCCFHILYYSHNRKLHEAHYYVFCKLCKRNCRGDVGGSHSDVVGVSSVQEM